jgi:anti-sigma factor RsiW
MSCQLWSERLDAYVDGEGPRDDLAAVEDHLRTCADCAREALGRMQLKRATHFAAQRFTLSPEFRLRVQNSIRQDLDRKSFWSLAWRPGLLALTATLLMIAASAILWSQHLRREQAVVQLIDLHVATLASSNPVDVVSTDRHTVKPWFQGRLPFSFNLPELAGTQFNLLGGKVAYLSNNPAAQLLFTTGKHKISVFIAQDQPGSPAAALLGGPKRDRGFTLETWSANGLCFVAISDASAADVNALAELLRAAGRS